MSPRESCGEARGAGTAGSAVAWEVCRPLLLVVALAAFMHWPVFLTGKTVSPFDLAYGTGAYAHLKPADFTRASNWLLSDPVAQFQAWDVAMYEGELEFPWLWNPYAGCGSPLLANTICAPFYPLKALYLLSGVRRGFGLVCFAKMALAGVFMLLFLRRIRLSVAAAIAGSWAFMSCGFMVTWLQWPQTNVALLLPAMLLAVELIAAGSLGAGFLVMTGSVAVGVLGGHPETLFHCVFASGCYLLLIAMQRSRMAWTDGCRPSDRPPLWRALCVFALAVAGGAGLCAFQLLPNLEYILSSDQLASRLPSEWHLGRALRLPSLHEVVHASRTVLALVLPNVFGNPSLHGHWRNEFSNYNESAGYVGLGMLVLAAAGWRYVRRDPRLLALGVVQLLSLGFILRVPPVTGTLGALPPFNVALNMRFLLVFCATVAGMGAIALDRWRGEKGRAAWTATVVIAAVGFCAALVLREYVVHFARNAALRADFHIASQLAHFALFAILSAGLLFWSRVGLGVARRVAVAGFCAASVADVILIHFGYNPFVLPDRVYPRTEAVAFLRSHQPARVLPLGYEMLPNVLAVYGVQDVRIYDALTYRPYGEYLARVRDSASPLTVAWNITTNAPTPLTSGTAVRYVWMPRGGVSPLGPERVRTVWEDASGTVLEDMRSLPHAYVATAWRTVGSTREALELLSRGEGDGAEVAVRATDGAAVPASVAPSSGTNGEVVPARIRDCRPHRVSVALPGRAGMLVLNDCLYPGWEARIDGRRAPIFCANGVFRGVEVDSGDQEVVFDFKPRSFTVGLWIAVAVAVSYVAFLQRWVRPPARSRNAAGA